MDSFNDINIKQWELKSHKGFMLTNTEYSRFEFPRHFHNYYTFMFVEKGVNEGFTGNHNYTVEPGSLLIINPGDVHAGKSYQKKFLKFYSFRVDEQFLKNLLTRNGIEYSGDIVFSTKPVHVGQTAKKFYSLFNAIKIESTSIELESLMTDILIKLIDDLNVNGNRLSSEKIDVVYLAKAKKYIEENYHESFELENLSKFCSISAYHLLRQFKNHFGLTPFEYLRNYRIEKAKEIINKNNSITEVAHSVGFYDHSHFLKNFKKITGMLPSQYQKVKAS